MVPKILRNCQPTSFLLASGTDFSNATIDRFFDSIIIPEVPIRRAKTIERGGEGVEGGGSLKK